MIHHLNLPTHQQTKNPATWWGYAPLPTIEIEDFEL